jgi:CubicO group peptidase (beta-lactamase class C family)
MRRAAAEGVFPGGVLLVAEGGRTRFLCAYGTADIFTGRPVTPETFFDLASLTKPLATAAALMVLVQRGRLATGQTLGSLLPAFRGTDKAGVTLAQLLAHTAGFPDYRPYFRQLAWVPPAGRREALQALLAAEPLAAAPGERTLYSDLGFLALQAVVEAVSGRRLDRFAAEAVYAPLGIGPLFFAAPDAGPPPAGEFAATELCPWRGRLIAGEVHDENAAALGGVAGHAGLFGTAAAVNGLLAAFLEAWHGRTGRLFAPETVRHFFRRAPGSERPLGFDTPSAEGSSSGRRFPPGSVGHLGFTGTSFWVDPGRAIAVTLLTNRVHPSRENIAIRRFRPELHDAVMEGLGA